MAVKNRGISPDLLIHPGETISDLLEERGMTQKELAQRSGVSEAFLSDVIHGKKDLSRGLARGLEYAFGVPVSFWLNLQANYDAELLALQEEESICENEKEVLTSIHDVVEDLRKQKTITDEMNPVQTVLSLRKVFHVSSLTHLRELAPKGAFRMSDKVAVNPDVLGAWLCLCKVDEGVKQTEGSFDSERTDELISRLKNVMINGKGDLQKTLSPLLSGYGIDFSIVHNFKGAPVHGYISLKDNGVYRMVLTLRGASADIFWFSLFHELGHIVNGDVAKPGDYIDADNSGNEKREHAADVFASRALISEADYQNFRDGKDYSYSAVKAFAQTQGVPSYVVIGRLQKEEIIPWSWYQKYKPKYKWAEA